MLTKLEIDGFQVWRQIGPQACSAVLHQVNRQVQYSVKVHVWNQVWGGVKWELRDQKGIF